MMASVSLLRERGRDEGRVAFVELFFDLVFVFAVTQLSHGLLAQLDLQGLLHTCLLLFAVWWVWIYTSWVTNWLDPERVPVRLCLFAMMIAGLAMSAAIPQAFGARGMAFALAYAAMQVGRTLFMLWCLRHGEQPLRRNFHRILVWLSVASAFWLLGGWSEGETRFACWLGAIALEFLAPMLGFPVPGLGRADTREWNVDGNHMAERCGLFVIIALGESLLITGATFAELSWSGEVVAAFATSAVGAIAMWWIYFDTGAKKGHHHIVHSDDPGRIARVAYTYLHLPIVAGIIVSAVADELVLAHPGHADTPAVFAILGGPALYLLGNALFKWVTNERRWLPFSHMIGLALIAVLALPAAMHLLSALALAALAAAVLVVVAAWESVSLRRPPATRPA